MKKLLACLLVAGLSAGILSGAEVAREKKTQFAVALNLVTLSEQGDLQAVIGPAGLVIFNIGRRFMIAPEVLLGVNGSFAGATFNVKFKGFFLGLGGVAGGLYKDRFEWNPISLLKVQAGIKGPRLIAALAYVNNLVDFYPKLSGLSLTVGYLF
jgi:hypothetical protein